MQKLPLRIGFAIALGASVSFAFRWKPRLRSVDLVSGGQAAGKPGSMPVTAMTIWEPLPLSIPMFMKKT